MSAHDYIALDSQLVNGIHIRRMGMSIWLFKFLVKKQTSSDGLVYYGRPITYKWIFSEIPNCVPERTLRLWMGILKVNGYVEIDIVQHGGMRIRIVNSKKWPTSQLGLFEASKRHVEKSWISGELPEENMSKCGNSSRHDLAGGSVKILPSLLYIEKDLERRKKKEATDVAAAIVEREYPGFRARPILGSILPVVDAKKKIS